MRKAILIIALMLLYVSAKAQHIKKGYHGFIEASYAFNLGGTISVNWAEINTIHGYQATPNLFVGAGVGFHFMPKLKKAEIGGLPHWKRDSKMEIPVFADFRWTILNKKVTPLVDLRLGHNVSNGSGMYASAGLGCRFALKNNKAISLIASYTTHKLKFEESNIVTAQYSYTWYYKEIDQEQSAISVKLGFEF